MNFNFPSLALRLSCCALFGLTIGSMTARADNISYGTNPGALQFTDSANWVGGIVPGTGDVAVIDSVDGITDYPFIDSSVEIQRFSIAAIDSATTGGLEFRNGANLTTSSSNSHFVGARGTGFLRVFDGATLDLAGNMIVGWSTTGMGTVNMSGGSVTMASFLQIAREGVGSFIQTGGDLAIFRGADHAMVVAPFAGATGYYEISGGSLSVNVLDASGGLTNGAVDGSGDATSTIKVVGNAPSITVNGNYIQFLGGTLSFDVGTGISPLNISGEATITGGLDVNFTTTPSVGQQFTILNYGGSLTGTFSTFDTQVNSPAGPNSVDLSIDYGTGVGSAIVLTVNDIVSTVVPGDFDGDGDVDGADFVIWQTNFPTQQGATLATGDADGDGDVDGADFVIWQTNFPFTPSGSAETVPEPAASALAMLGSLFALALRRRR